MSQQSSKSNTNKKIVIIEGLLYNIVLLIVPLISIDLSVMGFHEHLVGKTVIFLYLEF